MQLVMKNSFTNEVHSNLVKTLDALSPNDGMLETHVPDVTCIKLSHTDKPTKRRWHACIGIVAQGSKEIILGRETYSCAACDYTVTPMDLPVASRLVSATPAKPFLAILIKFDPLVLSEVASHIVNDISEPIRSPLRGLFIGRSGDAMMEAALRLSRLLNNPHDGPVLGPLVIKEIMYHLLKGSDGGAIRQYVLSGSKMHKISQAINAIKYAIAEDVDVEALARAMHMSRSAFFAHFKQATAMSPIQYQKRLRLLEARRLMTEEGKTAESSAYAVGYSSASQFSREYSRMFNNPPVKDAVKIKKQGHSIHQI